MRARLIEKMRARFAAYEALLATVDDDALTQTLDVPKHKPLRQHLWCVVGARESHARAIEAGTWQGFACSMSTYDHAAFSDALARSAEVVLEVIASAPEWDAARDELLLDLHEHEVMHEGQIIRHLYAVGRPLPPSFRWA